MDPNNPNQNAPTASTRAMPESFATQPIPSPTTAASTTIPSASPLESARTSRSSSEQEEPLPFGPSLSSRPTVGQRQPSGSMIVPADHPEIEAKRPISFPPGDARAMSPRRSNEDCNQLVGKARSGAQKYVLPAFQFTIQVLTWSQ